MLKKILTLSMLAGLGGCNVVDNSLRSICEKRVSCGYFSVQKAKESSPIFFASPELSSPYRICLSTGSIILQTIEDDGNASSLGGELRKGNCADISYTDKIYIVGNTNDGKSEGFYYRVPE